MITKHYVGDTEVVGMAIISPTRLTDAQALKQFDARSRRFLKAHGFRRCPYLPNCWHNPKRSGKAACRRLCREEMIRRAGRGEL